jgi:hypothetical protein
MSKLTSILEDLLAERTMMHAVLGYPGLGVLSRAKAVTRVSALIIVRGHRSGR